MFNNQLKGQRSELVHINKYLSFVITKSPQEINDKSEFRIIFHMKNISKKEISIEKPSCFGVNIMPFLSDSDGRPLPVQFRLKANCKGERYKVLPSETYEEAFIYDLHKCFDFSKQGTYFLKFEYYGNIYNTNGQRITLVDPLTSNVLKININ